MDFQDLLAKDGGFEERNRGRGGAIMTPNKLVFTFGGFYVCANRQTYTNRFYNLSHAVL